MNAQLRQRYHDRIQQIAPGARLARGRQEWTITGARRTDTGAVLQMRCRHHHFRLYVPVTLDGPELWHSGMRSVALPPRQREMFAAHAGLN
jgi:hypothetical protein